MMADDFDDCDDSLLVQALEEYVAANPPPKCAGTSALFKRICGSCVSSGIRYHQLHQQSHPVVTIRNSHVLELFKFMKENKSTFQDLTSWLNNLRHDGPELSTTYVRVQCDRLRKKLQQLRHPRYREQKDTLLNKEWTWSNTKQVSPGPVRENVLSNTSDASVLNHVDSSIDFTSSSNRNIALLESQLATCNRKLRKINRENHILRKKVRSNGNRNIQRRLKRRTEAHLKSKLELKELVCQVKRLQELNSDMKKQIRSLTESVRYHKSKRIDLLEETEGQIEETEEQIQKLLSVSNTVVAENEELQQQLEEVMSDKQVSLYDGGRYSDATRLVVYDLLSKGVSSRNVGSIIKTVLSGLTQLSVDRVPQATIVKQMSAEAALLAKLAAAHHLSTTEKAATLHTDGTTKKHRKYLDFLATTDQGNVSLALTEVVAGDAATQFESTQTLLENMAAMLVDSGIREGDRDTQLRQLLVKLQNVMTDRHVVNKLWAKHMQSWRNQVVPGVVDQWESFSEEVQSALLTVNDFYCGDHLLLNMQENTDANLKQWEAIESSGDQLGREKVIAWNRKKESATYCLIRSASTAFGPDAREDCGRPRQFETVLAGRKNHLLSYRGNRFNVPFKNASAVYHHRSDIIEYTSSLSTKDSNLLLTSLEADVKDPIIMGGVRAMAMVEKFITSPLLKMVDSKIHVLDASRYYCTLQEKLQMWAEDATELLDGNAILFPDYPPTKDEVYDSLCSDDIPLAVIANSKHALSVILVVLLLVVERALYDHLPGGKYHMDAIGPESILRSITETVPLNNKVAESLFSGLDRLKRCMPNSLTITLEGVLLWVKNRPLAILPSDQLQSMIAWAISGAKPARKLDSDKQKAVKEHYTKSEADRKLLKEEQLRKQARMTERNLEMIFAQPGGPCRSVKDVRKLLASKHSETQKRESLKTQIRYKLSIYHELLQQHRELTVFSAKGRPFTSSQLKSNLISIINLTSNITDEEDDTPLAAFADPDDDIPLGQLASFTEDDDISLRVVQRHEKRDILLEKLKDKVKCEHNKHHSED